MKFEEIATHIQKSTNTYEAERGIKTIKVELITKKDNWAIFLGHKSDRSKTLFFTRKNKRAQDDKWGWFCPSESKIDGFKLFCDMYITYNIKNDENRW